MATIPQIGNPVSGKGYQNAPAGKNPSGTGGELFDVIELSKPVEGLEGTSAETGSSTGYTGTTSKDFMPTTVRIAKDPTMAVESMKQIVSDDLLAVAKANGYTELYGEIDELMKGLYLTPETLVDEILMQESQNTMFSGDKIFDLLRNLSGTAKITANDDMKQAIGNFLKAYNFTQNKDEILNALSSNLKFLSEYFAPNKMLSQDLKLLSDQWGSQDGEKYFGLLKSETISILKNVSDSLLNNERTQILIPLITHNLSRYNTNKSMLTDSFKQLLSFVPSENMRSELIKSFNEIISKLESKFTENAPQADGTARPKTANIVSQYMNSADDSDVQMYTRTAGNNNAVITQNTENQPPEQNIENNQNNQNIQNNQNNQNNENVQNNQNSQNNQNNQNVENYQNNQNSENITSHVKLSADSEMTENVMPKALGELMNDEEYLNSLDFDTEDLHTPVRSYLLGKTDGLTAIGEILNTFAPNVNFGNMITAELEAQSSMESLINYLNDVLKFMPDIDEREILFESFSEIITSMAEKNELSNSKYNLAAKTAETVEEKNESSLNQLINFVDKNIGHSALKSINNYNASNLLQSLINAPGVFTPLAHYILPLEVEDTKAFGELWVNNDEETEGAGGGKRGYHLFLTFDIEAFGRFEVDLKSVGNEVNISLLHPDSFESNVDPLVRKVNRIVAGAGYNTKSFSTSTLKKPHNLTEVFPNILEKRTGFNVKA